MSPLELFGSMVVEKLRDGPLDFYDMLEPGKWKAPGLQQLQHDVQELSPAQREVLRRCLMVAIDGGIHDFLFALQEVSDHGGGPTVTVDGKNVAELSDGLHGEMFGETGWIAKFSKYSTSTE